MAVTYTPNHNIPLIDGESVVDFQVINDALLRIDAVLTLPEQSGFVREDTRFVAVVETTEWTEDAANDPWIAYVYNAAITPDTDVDIHVSVDQAGKVPVSDWCQPLAGRVKLFATDVPEEDVTLTVVVRGVA